MIKIEIDGKEIEELFKTVDQKFKVLEVKIKVLGEELESEKTKLAENIKQNVVQADEIIKLQQQIIDMQTEGTKERRSLWDFLKIKNKPGESKKSRITETTVNLDK